MRYQKVVLVCKCRHRLAFTGYAMGTSVQLIHRDAFHGKRRASCCRVPTETKPTYTLHCGVKVKIENCITALNKATTHDIWSSSELGHKKMPLRESLTATTLRLYSKFVIQVCKSVCLALIYIDLYLFYSVFGSIDYSCTRTERHHISGDTAESRYRN